MKGISTIIAGLSLLYAGGAQAQSAAHSASDLLSTRIKELVSASIHKAGLNKTTATERVILTTKYQPQQSRMLDSTYLHYSNGRGSAFDFVELNYYDQDLPNPVDPSNNHVDFDWSEPVIYQGTVRRTYNSANKVSVSESYNTRLLYQYDAGNRLTVYTHLALNSSSILDSFQRWHYKYDASGRLSIDSFERWDAKALEWVRQLKTIYSYDASGRPSTLNIFYYYGNTNAWIRAQTDLGYTGASTLISSATTYYEDPITLQLFNDSKDSFLYSNGAMIFSSASRWNDTTSSWSLKSQEFRHLNPANLPDSVSFFSWAGGRAYDSSFVKMSYNGQNNPIEKIYYQFPAPTDPLTIMHWKYEGIEAAGVKNPEAKQLKFYPNPADDQLYLKGINSGSYTIYNTAGQLTQSGTIEVGATVPLESLMPGFYLLRVQEGNSRYQASFIRR